jgi:hypothetical protein
MDIYKIEHIYKKQRRRFGGHYQFEDTDVIVLANIKPNLVLNDLYIDRDPCHKGVQAAAEMSNHEVSFKFNLTMSGEYDYKTLPFARNVAS